jgi:hypothetical protein
VEICEDSDLVVGGSVEKNSGSSTIRVSRWLKGSGPQALPVDDQTDLREGQRWGEYLFFLNSKNGKRRASILAVRFPEHEPHISEILAMQANPADFLLTSKPNADFAELLGQWFKGRAFVVPESSGLGWLLARRDGPDRNDVWQPEEVVVARCQASERAQGGFEILSVAPSGIVADYLRKCSLNWARSYSEDLPPGKEFTVTFDTRLPKESRGIKYSQAVEYLHLCARSNDLKIAQAAIRSLSLLRDRSAVPLLVERLESAADSDETVYEIVVFLGQSADPRAVDSLCAILWRQSAKDDGGSFSDAVSRAESALKMIGDQRARPALEYFKDVSAARYARMIFADALLGDSIPEALELQSFKKLREELVRGSNCREEEWMKEIGNAESRGELREKWISWWSENKKTIRAKID